MGGLRRSHPDEKCDGRDQDCAREKNLEADDGGFLRRLFGLIVVSLHHWALHLPRMAAPDPPNGGGRS